MLLGGFFVELSVDGKLLKEYNEPANNRTMTTGVSYVLDQQTGEKVESDQTFYVAVEQADKSYEILFGAKKELFTTEEQQSSAISFKAKIYVDGQWDRSLRSINKPVKMKKDGLIGDKRKKTPLMFDVSKWEENDDKNVEKDDEKNDDDVQKKNKEEDTESDNDDNLSDEKKPENQDKFGYGAISVYFFNAKDIDKNETATPVPLAALHLHYRSTQWLLVRNILIEEKSDDIFDETQAIKDADETAQQKIKPHSRKGKNKNEQVKTTATEIVGPADDECDISEWTGKLTLDDTDDTQVVEENQGIKKKPRGKKEKKDTVTESIGAKRYNLRKRK